MNSKLQHRGVIYSVEPLGEQRWRWEISPPTCVVGMSEKVGEIDGDEVDAVRAAHKAIEAQVALN
jgi:hypothetical protein